MNFTQSKFYINHIMNSDADDISLMAVSVGEWFLDCIESGVSEEFPEDERELQLMSAPAACATLLSITSECLADMGSEMEDLGTYDGRFEWDDDEDMVPGVTQAFHIGHKLMTEDEFTPEQFALAAKQMYLVLQGVAHAITQDDRRAVAVRIVGTIPDEISPEVQKEICDDIHAVFASRGIDLTNTLINVSQPSTDGKGSANVTFEH